MLHISPCKNFAASFIFRKLVNIGVQGILKHRVVVTVAVWWSGNQGFMYSIKEDRAILNTANNNVPHVCIVSFIIYKTLSSFKFFLAVSQTAKNHDEWSI